MLTTHFNKLTLEKKLYLMHFIVTGAALLMVFVVLITYQYLSYKQELIDDLNAQLSVIETNMGAAISFQDKDAANEILDSLKLNIAIDRAYVMLDQNNIFAEYRASSLSENHQLKSANPQLTTSNALGLHLSRTILVNQQKVGTLNVEANLNKLHNRIQVFSLALVMAAFLALLLARVVSFRLNRYLTRPIDYLKSLVASVSQHQNYHVRSDIVTHDEIGALSLGINNMLENIEMRDHQLDQLAYFDALTTLPNRHNFNAYISTLITHEAAAPFYLLQLDLDDFKITNDTLGHAAGDVLLCECSHRIKSILDDQQRVFRVGGDEFAITLQGGLSQQDVEGICNHIIQTVSQKFVIQNHELYVGVSIGIVQFHHGNYDESSLIKNVDVAMYWAKSDGKNRYKFYSQEIEEVKFKEQQLMLDLQCAILNNEFEVYYQPIISVKSGLILGFEALLRWHHPMHGIVSPMVFIPLAESSGLINPIGIWVINQALSQLNAWQTKYSPQLFVNINISGHQFLDLNIVSKITAAINKNAVEPSTVNFEITESVLMRDVERTIQVLKSLRALGANISIDDFGTGHSSMSYLKQFPINTIKIDKGFVQGIPDDKIDVAIIESIFALAKSLSFDVVAEGIETEQQFAFLKEHHCAKAQGYLFSKPISSEQVDPLLQQLKGRLHHNIHAVN
jgi:diguanylate cyclase (GGDEF)-like protein